MHDYVVDERKGPVKILPSFPADAEEQKLLQKKKRGTADDTLLQYSTHDAEIETKRYTDVTNRYFMCLHCIPTWPMSPTTLPVPSILGLLHSAPAKSVRAAAV